MLTEMCNHCVSQDSIEDPEHDCIVFCGNIIFDGLSASEAEGLEKELQARAESGLCPYFKLRR